MVRRLNRGRKPAQPQPDNKPAAKPLFGGKGDHDGDGKAGGAHPQLDQAAIDAAAQRVVLPPQEPSLRELNERAREIDRQHAELRARAKEAADAAAKEQLKGIATFRKPRRMQKPLRPPLTAPVKEEAKA